MPVAFFQKRLFFSALHSALLCFAMLAHVCSASAQTWSGLIDDFAYPSSAPARLSWKAGPATLPAQVQRQEAGLRLPCAFSENTQRVYWEKTVSLNLAGRSALELEITCPHPAAIRSLLVYAKSGNGWYVWRLALDQPGRRRHILPLHQASVEGQPKGWNLISAIRISASKGNGETYLLLHNLKTLSCGLLLVQASRQSAGTEAMAARNAANRVSRKLNELTIPHLLVQEEQASTALESAGIVLLPYAPALSDSLLAALEKFARRGGKLIVFYSSSEKLAKLMDVALGEYRRSPTPGHWSSFTFQVPTPTGAPPTIFQDSSNIRPVKPIGKKGRVLAFWNDENGRRLSEPAWVQTEKGLWMTHVLTDGDDENKKRMLAALIAIYDPSIWQRVAEQYRNIATQTGPYANLPAAQAGIRELARINGRAQLVTKPLSKATETANAMTAMLAKGNYSDAIEQAVATRTSLIEAYALAHAPVKNEFRGLWCHAGQGLYPGDWDRTAAVAANNGFNAIFPNLLWAGSAHYPSIVLPASDISRLYGDQIAACSKAAAKHSLQLHIWMACWKLGNTTPDFRAKLRAENRLQVNDKLQPLDDWLCPANPENIKLELAAISEIMRRGAVQGIHLDYIRFPDSHSCFCSTCRKLFEGHIGKQVQAWPGNVISGPYSAAWRNWRKGVITAFVKSARQEIQRANPGVKLSAAVYSSYPECAASIGQDWGAWLKEGIVDFVCPMTYQTDMTRFTGLTRQHLAIPGTQGKIYPGLGVVAAESRLSPDQVISQIAWLRANGASGFMLFDLTRTLQNETLPFLKLGVTQPHP